MALERFWEQKTTLDYPIDLVHRSLNDLQRMHKWNATVYFEEEGPGEVDCKFLLVVPGYSNRHIIHSHLVVSRAVTPFPDVPYPIISYGSRGVEHAFPVCGGNIFRIELYKNVEFPDEKTDLIFHRTVFFGDDPEINMNLRTRLGKINEVIFDGLKRLEIDDDGLLSLPGKPLIYQE